MLKQTPLYHLHCKANAHLTDFAGWEMPLHYGSQLAEHHAVRKSAGMFDVSHMGIVDISGVQSRDFLRYMLANDIAKLTRDGNALYTCMLNPKAGVIDDLIVYRLNDDHYRMVCNAACFEKDLNWLNEHAKHYEVQLQPRPDLTILALQGPRTMELIKLVLPETYVQIIHQLKPFNAFFNNGRLYARTGYTGEDGIECIIPAADAVDLWQLLLEQQVLPCGLAARDTLRLEAGLNLYGQDMDETTSPLESNLAWTVSTADQKRAFIGREALAFQLERGLTRKLTGLVLEVPGMLRNHQTVICNEGRGEITSGSFSPTLGKAIALARLPILAKEHAQIERRGLMLPATIIKPPFVRFGKTFSKSTGVVNDKVS